MFLIEKRINKNINVILIHTYTRISVGQTLLTRENRIAPRIVQEILNPILIKINILINVIF
jgi:hypothetical protein